MDSFITTCGEILACLALLSIPVFLFFYPMAYILIFGSYNPFKGDKKIVQANGETFEFRFWEDEYGLLWAGVYRVGKPRKIFGKEIPQHEELSKAWGMDDRVDWCWEVLAERQASKEQRDKDVANVKAFIEGA